MKLTYEQYLDKVRGCWLGKNIGGTLGIPFEGKRGTFDIEYYTHDISGGMLPNDDLDLQLVFLNAAERYGKALTAENLADYWVYGIPCDWSEYGAGRANIGAGIAPPLSGGLHNEFRNSCGCFIRSELWACLAPGHPEIAVQYAYKDAIVDHADEGVYGEVFCAAIQSAAFGETDANTLIDIGLSYIPEDSALAGAVRLARQTWLDQRGWKEARKAILLAYPDTFGLMRSAPDPLIPRGELGFDAPANIALMVMAWLYGQGDFSRSICIAAGCGEDADCTAGTLAATLGIAFGTGLFEERWTAPIGTAIKTFTVDRTKEDVQIPETIDQLTDRVAKLMPVFLHGYCSFEGGVSVELQPVAARPVKTGWFVERQFRDVIRGSFGTFTAAATTFALKAGLAACEVQQGSPLQLTVTLENSLIRQQWIELELFCIENGQTHGYRKQPVFLNQHTAGYSEAVLPLALPTEGLAPGRHELHILAAANGAVSRAALQLPFFIL